MFQGVAWKNQLGNSTFDRGFQTAWFDLQMKRFQNTVGPSMINKSLPHVEFIVKKVDSLTRGKERERLLRILDGGDEDDATQKM